MSAGSHRRSLRREIRSINRGLEQAQREWGDLITWYEFDSATTTVDDTYGEGPIPHTDTVAGPQLFVDSLDGVDHTGTWQTTFPGNWAAAGAETWQQVAAAASGLRFKAPVQIPAVWFRFDTPVQVQTDAGLYTVNRSLIRFSAQAMRSAGLRSPQDPALHFSDRFSYKGVLYRVERWDPRGWLHGVYLMVDVTGRELKEEELEADSFPFAEAVESSTPWTPGQQLNWPAIQPTDWENRT